MKPTTVNQLIEHLQKLASVGLGESRIVVDVETADGRRLIDMQSVGSVDVIQNKQFYRVRVNNLDEPDAQGLRVVVVH